MATKTFPNTITVARLEAGILTLENIAKRERTRSQELLAIGLETAVDVLRAIYAVELAEPTHTYDTKDA